MEDNIDTPAAAPIDPAQKLREDQMRILRLKVRGMYDMQKLRISFGNREKSLTALLTDTDKAFFAEQRNLLEMTEKHALVDLNKLLIHMPIAQWLMEQRGIRETLAAVIVGYINIEKCTTVSKLWRFTGLATMPTGQPCATCGGADIACTTCYGKGHCEAERLRVGQKAHFDPWLKSKMIAVLGGCFIKAAGLDEFGYYVNGRSPNPFFDPQVPAPKKKEKQKGRKGAKPKKPKKGEVSGVRPEKDIMAALAETSLEVEPTPDEEAEEQRYALRLHHTGEPTRAELESVRAPAYIRTIIIRRPFTGYINDPSTGMPLNAPWRKFYDDRKHRKENTLVRVCMGCRGTGTYKLSSKEEERLAKLKTIPREKLRPEEIDEFDTLLMSVEGKRKCNNCGGTGGPAPWGRSRAHRSADAQRYMVKMFLMALWFQWRRLENLPIRQTYAEEYLNRGHHHDNDRVL